MKIFEEDYLLEYFHENRERKFNIRFENIDSKKDKLIKNSEKPTQVLTALTSFNEKLDRMGINKEHMTDDDIKMFPKRDIIEKEIINEDTDPMNPFSD